MRPVANVTCVALAGRGLLIIGAPGRGKTSLALALIDRGAVLVGDDGIMVEQGPDRIWAHPPRNIAGKLEIRGVGIATLPTSSAPLCLALDLDEEPERYPQPKSWTFQGQPLPRLAFRGGDSLQAIRAEYALQLHGLPLPPAYA